MRLTVNMLPGIAFLLCICNPGASPVIIGDGDYPCVSRKSMMFELMASERFLHKVPKL
jgi:hypothetical protein